MGNRRLQAFISSRMTELAPERDLVKKSLDELEVDAWVFEDAAGARPKTIQETYLEEVENADIYIGIFWKGYGEYTIEEFEHAQKSEKPCLIYEKREQLDERDEKLKDFLDSLSDVESGLTIQWFNGVDEIGEYVRRDVAAWLTEEAREHKTLKEQIEQLPLLPKIIWKSLKENRAFALISLLLQIAILFLFLQYKDLYRISWGVWGLAAVLFVPLLLGWYRWRKKPSKFQRPLTIILTASFIALFSWQVKIIAFPKQFEENVFGIAVADLGYNMPWRAFDETHKLSEYLYEHLAPNDLPDNPNGSEGIVEFRRIGYVSDSTVADRFGKRINADMVIWGRVIKSTGGGTVIYFEVLETPDWSDKPDFPLLLPVTNTSTDIFYEELDPKSDLASLKKAVRNETAIITSFIRGYAAYLDRDFAVAINHFTASEKAIRENPDLVVSQDGLSLLYLNLGKANSHLGRLEEGMDWYEKAEIANPKEPAIPLSKALIYGSWGNELRRDSELAKAHNLINNWIQIHTLETHPNQFNAAIYNRGIIRQINKEYISAIIDFEQVITNDPKFYIAYLNLGQAARDYGDYAKAEESLIEAVEVAKESGANASWAYVNLAWLYERMEDRGSAKEAYKTAIELNPDEMLMYFFYGEFLDKKGETDAAIISYQTLIEKATEQGQNIGWAYGKLADILFRQNLFRDAAKKYEMAVHYQPADELLTTHLAEAYHAIGENEKAKGTYEKTVALDKDNYYVYASYGGFLYSTGSHEAAIENYQKALALRPIDGNVLFNLGMTYEALNMKNEAQETYGRIIAQPEAFSEELIIDAKYRLEVIGDNP